MLTPFAGFVWAFLFTVIVVFLFAPFIGLFIKFRHRLYLERINNDHLKKLLDKKHYRKKKSWLLKRALKSSSPALRLRAASEIGREAEETASAILDSDADSVLRIDALRVLWAMDISDEDRRRYLEEALRSNSDSLRASAVTCMGESSDESVRREVIEFITDGDTAVRLAALEVLGKIGTRECVEKLLPYTEGVFADGDVKKAAREAVERIQSRLGNAEAGRISVVDATDEAGRISVAEIPDGAGRIAVVELPDARKVKGN